MFKFFRFAYARLDNQRLKVICMHVYNAKGSEIHQR